MTHGPLYPSRLRLQTDSVLRSLTSHGERLSMTAPADLVRIAKHILDIKDHIAERTRIGVRRLSEA